MANIEILPSLAKPTGTYWPHTCPECNCNLDEVLSPPAKEVHYAYKFADMFYLALF